MTDYLLGIDLGGTNVNVGVVDRSGKVITQHAVPLDAPQTRRDVLCPPGDALDARDVEPAAALRRGARELHYGMAPEPLARGLPRAASCVSPCMAGRGRQSMCLTSSHGRHEASLATI